MYNPSNESALSSNTSQEIKVLRTTSGQEAELLTNTKYDMHNLPLRVHWGQEIKVLRTTQKQVNYQDKHLSLSAYLVSGPGPSLLGRDCVTPFQLNLGTFNTINTATSLEAQLFCDELGCYNGPPI